MKPLYIFDLDGTLALTDHRQPILDDRENPNRWRDFFAACVRDQPNLPVISTMRRLRFEAEVWIWSGRSDEVRDKTVEWLSQFTSFSPWELCDGVLRMRPAGDYTADEVLKQQWLNELSAHDRSRLVAVFDDRDKVVAMWRGLGVPCFQVAPGGF